MNDGNKVTFSPEFIEKTKYKKPKTRKRNKLLKTSFSELTVEQLSKAETRGDVARLMGYSTPNMKAGNTYVGALIRDGKLVEVPLGYNKGRSAVCNYYFASDDRRVKDTIKTTEIEKPIEKKSSILITIGDVNITLEDPTSEMVEIVFKNLGILKESV